MKPTEQDTDMIEFAANGVEKVVEAAKDGDKVQIFAAGVAFGAAVTYKAFKAGIEMAKEDKNE